jgi:hypothetical protein
MDKELEQQSVREMEQLSYVDTLVNLNGMFEQYGCRTVLKDFRDAFPEMFKELAVQLTRLPPDKEVAALLR